MGRYPRGTMSPPQSSAFDPAAHRAELEPLLAALAAAPELTGPVRDRLLAEHPKDGRGLFSKTELLAALRWFEEHAPGALGDADAARLAARLRGKPVRTLSGVAVVTVFTPPHPCPGRCVFCPSDVRMPKSYLADEPGCQRAAANRFDPYAQTWNRLLALADNGHAVDKVELLVLGGTWSSYPERYRARFVARCFEALNDFGAALAGPAAPGSGASGVAACAPAAGAEGSESPGEASTAAPVVDGRRLHRGVGADGTSSNGGGAGAGGSAYNPLVRRLHGRVGGVAASGPEAGPVAGGGARARTREPDRPEPWRRLADAHEANEGAGVRCVGLVLETRPDSLGPKELLRLRRLGATRVQIGVQSLSDAVLERNLRGHDVVATRRAFRLLRAAGFKIQAHWMANLLGSDPEADAADYRRLFRDPDLRPDELKIYPCTLVESAELMRFWEAGEWHPYDDDELLELVIRCMLATPRWCRLSRVVRDIPGTGIVAGSRVTNLRQVAEEEIARRGLALRDVRAREVGRRGAEPGELALRETGYATAVGEERFLELVTPGDRLAAFLRLSLPRGNDALEGLPQEIAGELEGAAVIREVHVYGRVAALGDSGGPASEAPGRAQHRGLGRRLVRRAAALAAARGHRDLAVISAVGTREYYRRLGFTDGALYQHRALGGGRPRCRLPGP